ncbi:unnamed protein product [Notodromas monacha]|uniref:PTHB1 n=1 Tax=Notodromas monacha TaxID=399045 RepID=A0A7R9BCF5_9CRUS|nr:unnamed protein product [Notodromas monacha]CAG0912731.1 unnamed protein product [Notodromas monacha]
MSIFKAREWLTVHVGSEEEFGPDSVLVANIDNNGNGHQRVIVGGFQGSLAILGPSWRTGDDADVLPSPDEIILETILDAPVLKVAFGKFSAAVDKSCLAVLHPRKVCVYFVMPADGNVAYGKQYTLSLSYQHNLDRNAFTFTHGPFGGVKGKDFLCVLSLDGTLTVFEQETHAFSRFLPNFLLPGPIVYLNTIDAFVVASSDFGIECYKYKSLAIPTSLYNPEVLAAKRLNADWVYNFGEQVLDLKLVEFEAKTVIVALCDRSLYAIEDYGVLRFAKSFEYAPIAFTLYAHDYEDTVMTLVASAVTQTLLVYKENVLKWMCQLPFTPIAITRGDFSGLRGSIVAVSDVGCCVCCYLGTDPSLFVAPALDTRDIDYGSADEELKELHKAIRDASKSTHGQLLSNRKEKELFATWSILNEICVCQYETAIEDGVMIGAKITLSSPLPLNSVRLAIDVPRPLAVSKEVFAIPSLKDEWMTEVDFYQCNAFLPSSMEATIVVTYSSGSAPRVERSKMKLPLTLVGKAVCPVREADYKITLATSQTFVNLCAIFNEFEVVEGSSATAFAFQFFCGPTVTVLASKNSQKYRLQSDDLPALWLLVDVLVSRVEAKFASQKEDVCSFASTLPLHEVYLEMDAHFEAKMRFEASKATLGQRAGQFRAIQRRLLIQLREKTPVPLTNLDSILEGTFQQIVELEKDVRMQENRVYQCISRLACCLNLLLLLVKIMTRMDEDEYRILISAIVPPMRAGGSQAWEALTDTTLVHLLKTQLNKTGVTAKQGLESVSALVASAGVQGNSKFDLKDLPKLKKHLAAVFDKLQKGGRVSNDLKVKSGKEANPFMLEAFDRDGTDDQEASVPKATRLGSAKGRISSGVRRNLSATIAESDLEIPPALPDEPDESKAGDW